MSLDMQATIEIGDLKLVFFEKKWNFFLKFIIFQFTLQPWYQNNFKFDQKRYPVSERFYEYLSKYPLVS